MKETDDDKSDGNRNGMMTTMMRTMMGMMRIMKMLNAEAENEDGDYDEQGFCRVPKSIQFSKRKPPNAANAVIVSGQVCKQKKRNIKKKTHPKWKPNICIKMIETMQHMYDDDRNDDDDDDAAVVDDDDNNDVDVANDGDDDDDDDEEDDDEEDEDEDENEDDDPPPARNLLSGGTREGSNLGLPGDGVQLESFRVSNGPGVCLFLARTRATSASTASFREKFV